MPAPGYYDTEKCYDKTFGKSLVNAVQMQKDIPRGDGIFKGCQASNLAQDQNQLANQWINKEIPQAYMNFKGMMSRKEQTVAHGLTELKWMHKKSADEIARAKLSKAREEHINENEDKGKRQEQIDWSTENKCHPFTFDITKMATCTQLYKTGMRMMEEKIELELAEPDDFSSLNIYNQ